MDPTSSSIDTSHRRRDNAEHEQEWNDQLLKLFDHPDDPYSFPSEVRPSVLCTLRSLLQDHEDIEISTTMAGGATFLLVTEKMCNALVADFNNRTPPISNIVYNMMTADYVYVAYDRNQREFWIGRSIQPIPQDQHPITPCQIRNLPYHRALQPDAFFYLLYTIWSRHQDHMIVHRIFYQLLTVDHSPDGRSISERVESMFDIHLSEEEREFFDRHVDGLEYWKYISRVEYIITTAMFRYNEEDNA